MAIRGTGIQASSASSWNVPWPAGTLSGDLAIVWAESGYNLSTPSGWTALDTTYATGGACNVGVWYRVLNSTDISTGHVTVSAAGSYDGAQVILTMVGNPGSPTNLASSANQTSGTSSRTVSASGAAASDLLIYVGLNRPGGSGSTNTASRGTLQQQLISAPNVGGCLYTETGVSGSVSVTFSFSSFTSGDYGIIVDLPGAGVDERGHIAYNQIRAAHRQGSGTQFQMFGGGSPTSGQPVLYDGAGNVVPGLVTETGISLSDVTTANVSITKHGFAPKAPNDVTKYLDGTGLYSIPAGGGGSSLLTTKGDVFGYSTVNARIPVGADGQVLTADSVQTLGVKWGAMPAVIVTGPSTRNNVTASRVIGSVYQNTSSKSLYIGVTVSSTSTPALGCFTDSSNPPTTIVSTIPMGASGSWYSGFFVVIPGDYYKITVSSGTIVNWTEWTDGSTNTALTLTKGDLVTYDTQVTKLPVGTDGQVLTADSTQAKGIKWAGPRVVGAAIFSLTGGSISNATYYGVVSGATRTGVGAVTINLSPSQANFTVSIIGSDDAAYACVGMLSGTPNLNSTLSSFPIGIVRIDGSHTGGGAVDAGMIAVTIFKF
jgi:hypothetical protein